MFVRKERTKREESGSWSVVVALVTGLSTSNTGQKCENKMAWKRKIDKCPKRKWKCRGLIECLMALTLRLYHAKKKLLFCLSSTFPNLNWLESCANWRLGQRPDHHRLLNFQNWRKEKRDGSISPKSFSLRDVPSSSFTTHLHIQAFLSKEHLSPDLTWFFSSISFRKLFLGTLQFRRDRDLLEICTQLPRAATIYVQDRQTDGQAGEFTNSN